MYSIHAQPDIRLSVYTILCIWEEKPIGRSTSQEYYNITICIHAIVTIVTIVTILDLAVPFISHEIFIIIVHLIVVNQTPNFKPSTSPQHRMHVPFK
jgi:hypothetical protein